MAGLILRIKRGQGLPSMCSYRSILVLAGNTKIQKYPSRDKEHAADGGGDPREGAVGVFGDGECSEDIERAAEEDDAHDKAVARPDHPFIVDLFREKGDKEKCEDMIELITHAGFKNGYRLGADHGFEFMGGKGAKSHGECAQDGGDR